MLATTQGLVVREEIEVNREPKWTKGNTSRPAPEVAKGTTSTLGGL